MPQIVIPYSPHQKQLEVHEHPARFKVIAAGRRSGKTTLAINELIKQAVEHPQLPGLPIQRSWYICDTYRHAEMIAWRAFLKFCPKELIKSKQVNKLMAELVNGHVIEFKGSEDPDKLRGVALVFVIFEEYGQMKPEAWTEVIRPSLIDMQGKALFIGTPGADGSPHFQELFRKGQTGDDGFKSWLFFTTDNTCIEGLAEEVEKARKELPPDIFKREFEADFSSTAGLIYDNFKHSIHVVPHYEPDAFDYVVGAIDPGLHNPTGALLVAWDKEGRGVIFKEYYEKGLLASENAARIKEMAKGYKVAYWVIDKSCVKRDPATGVTVFGKFREGLAPDAVITAENDPGSVWAGIDEVKKQFHVDPLSHRPKLTVCVQNHWFLWEIGRYIRYKHKWHVERNEEEKPRKLHDHLMDCIRMMVQSRPWIRRNVRGLIQPKHQGGFY